MEQKLIMIVEDCEMMRKFLKIYCEKLGKVITYESANEALQSLTVKNIPDLIVSDLNLPGINGKEFISQLRNKSISKKIPVIILTGEANVELKLDCLSLGAVDYLSKPFHPKELQLRLKRILGQFEPIL